MDGFGGHNWTIGMGWGWIIAIVFLILIIGIFVKFRKK